MLAAYGVAGLPPRGRAAGSSGRCCGSAWSPPGFHLVVNGWERAVVVVGVLAVLVLLAALVTLTTRTTDLVDAVVAGCRPLRRAPRRPRADRA